MRINIVFILLFGFSTLFAQEEGSAYNEINELMELGKTIREHQAYQVRKKANTKFKALLEEFLSTEEGYEHPLKQVNTMAGLNAEKNEFRIFTWLMRDSLFEYVTFGLIAAKTRKGIVVTHLQDKGKTMAQPEFKILKSGNWMGAVYYKIIPIKKNRKVMYTLLGYAPGSPVQKKIIEVITVDRRGVPKFGSKVFFIEDFQDKKFRKPPMRLILAYSSDYSASVKWNAEEELIIMDHLSPPDPKLKGVYRTYGPDMSYDSLEWDDDWWRLVAKPDFNTGQDAPIRPPDRPIGPPKR